MIELEELRKAPWLYFRNSRLYDLAQPIEAGMPVSPNHPGFKMSLMRRHGDMVRADGGSASNEMILLGGHTGTHIDALCHVSHQGKLFGGQDAYEAQRGGRFRVLGVESIPITFCRGVLLDIAGLHGVPVLDPGTPVTAADLEGACSEQGIEVREGDAVLIRCGWSAHWGDPEAFLGHKTGVPGPDESAARWLADRRIRLTGAETIAYEWIPPGRGHALLPVHRILLVEQGIHIIEAMNLAEIARDRVFEFLFVLCPIKTVGATGIPVRPVGVAS
ncbi:MAG: cyclase family protein [Acidobacteria bacterium]|nr:cyclase family protein [Acidobacteriota bacterium]